MALYLPYISPASHVYLAHIGLRPQGKVYATPLTPALAPTLALALALALTLARSTPPSGSCTTRQRGASPPRPTPPPPSPPPPSPAVTLHRPPRRQHSACQHRCRQHSACVRCASTPHRTRHGPTTVAAAAAAAAAAAMAAVAMAVVAMAAVRRVLRCARWSGRRAPLSPLRSPPCISPASPLYLPYISPPSALERQALGAQQLPLPLPLPLAPTLALPLPLPLILTPTLPLPLPLPLTPALTLPQPLPPPQALGARPVGSLASRALQPEGGYRAEAAAPAEGGYRAEAAAPAEGGGRREVSRASPA